MPVQPDKKLEQIQFAETHWPVWNTVATDIGLSADAVTAIKNATAKAREQYNSAVAARQAARAATLSADNAIASMRGLVADAIKSIRLFAESTNNPDVYSKAEIPAPQPASPALPPTRPINVSFNIEPGGALKINWSNAASTPGFDDSTQNVIYTVRRRVNNQPAFSIIGAVPASRSGRRGFTSFTDDTLAAGSTNIQYIIAPQRGTLNGPSSDVYTVMLGVAGGGGVGAVSVTSTPAAGDIRLAA